MADRALLERVMADQGVIVEPSEPSIPAWMGAWVEEKWAGFVDRLDTSGPADFWVLVVLGVLGVAFLLALTILTLRGLRRAVRPASPLPSVPQRPAGSDLAALIALLDAGRVREAARAGWVWMAEGLTGRGVGELRPHQTHGEFLATVSEGYRDRVRPLRDEADVLCYAPAEPSVEAVRGWIERAGSIR